MGELSMKDPGHVVQGRGLADSASVPIQPQSSS